MESDLIYINRNCEENSINISSELNSLQLIMSSLKLDANKATITSNLMNDILVEPSTSASTPSTSFSASIRARRRSSEQALLKLNRRVISKPKKKDILKITDSSEKEIKNFYLNNKITSQFRPTSLETIVEDPVYEDNEDAELIVRPIKFLGSRKLKRRISFTDCLNVPKSVVQNRRKKIKRLLGKKLNFNRLSMDAFYSHLKRIDYDSNESQSDVEYSSVSSDKMLLDQIKGDTKQFSNEI